MPRIRSKKLYRYLRENDGLGNPRELKRLKREYRRQYQNQWARQNRKKHEIRFTLSKEEYQKIKICCQQESNTPTVLAKDLLICRSKNEHFVANKKDLLAVAKELGLVINRLKSRGVNDTILEKLLLTEMKLLNYLNV